MEKCLDTHSSIARFFKWEGLNMFLGRLGKKTLKSSSFIPSTTIKLINAFTAF
jgi:hypothetical protein